jgi:Protein of unknown function (DUF1501)
MSLPIQRNLPMPDWQSSAILTRREALRHLGGGFGYLAFASLLAEEAIRSDSLARGAATETNSLAAKPPHFPPKAKRVIFLFMDGGPSQVDTFDPKPRLHVDHGKPCPIDISKLRITAPGDVGFLMESPFKFKKYGQSGIEVSEIFPHIASCVDDLCVIRSIMHEDANHPGARFLVLTGDRRFVRPSIGAWVTYGLGTENQNLPAFVAISVLPPDFGVDNYGSAFLPAIYEGTHISNIRNPIRNLQVDPDILALRRQELDAIQKMNRRHLDARQEDSRLSSRMETFELAYRMQSQSPEAFDVSKESAATKRLYGIGSEPTNRFGQQCLLARRLAEQGVRFVLLMNNEAPNGNQYARPWDSHDAIQGPHRELARWVDQPIAGLLKDLKSRGLLEDTLVIWGGEFGRLPTSQLQKTGQSLGRDHSPYGFTMWLAGGGVKGGMTYGMTDEFGLHAVQDKVHVHDLHATILHLLGLDHKKLTYRYSGRDFRLTDVRGEVVQNILA